MNQAIRDGMPRLPPADAEDYVDDLRRTHLGPIAESIRNLRDPRVGGVDSVDDLPEALRELSGIELALGP